MSAAPATPPPTYRVSHDRKSILCFRCGRRSHSAGDVQHLYCGACGYHPIARDSTHSPTALVSALIARAIYAAQRRGIPEGVTEHLKEAQTLVDAELAMDTLKGMGGE